MPKIAEDLIAKSTLLYILGHLLDLITTYFLSPDLSAETNILVARFGLGWDYVLLSAATTSALMLAAQYWLWTRLLQRFPDKELGYRDFYHRVLFAGGGEFATTRGHRFTGMLIGVICITAYALIAAKLLAATRNLVILATGWQNHDFVMIMLAKNLVAGLIGVSTFFIYPFVLHRRGAGPAGRGVNDS